jgi:hypothetical protein
VLQLAQTEVSAEGYGSSAMGASPHRAVVRNKASTGTQDRTRAAFFPIPRDESHPTPLSHSAGPRFCIFYSAGQLLSYVSVGLQRSRPETGLRMPFQARLDDLPIQYTNWPTADHHKPRHGRARKAGCPPTEDEPPARGHGPDGPSFANLARMEKLRRVFREAWKKVRFH